MKSQYTNYSLGFQPMPKDVKEIVAKKRKKRQVRGSGQTFDAAMKIPLISVAFPISFYFINPILHPFPLDIRSVISE